MKLKKENKGQSNEKATHKCPFCGHKFKKGESSACQGCPMSAGCKRIKCTNCGYEFIPGVDER